MANRKDSNGRVLKTGESQRADGTYMYRYSDIRGNRQSVYASDLQELRKKEKTIQKDLDDGIDYAAGNITVLELVKRYVRLKRNLKQSTIERYHDHINTIAKTDFAYKKVKDVKRSDAQQWILELHESGKKTSTIKAILYIVIPAFEIACNEDAIRKNPFSFQLSEFLPNDKAERQALTPAQQESLIEFVSHDKVYMKYYDMLIVLLGTGMRISEFCGLTVDDIDFEKRRIFVNKQMVYGDYGQFRIERPKTEHSIRYIAITDFTYQSLKNLVDRSQKSNIINMVSGFHGFISLKPNGKVFMHVDVDNMFSRLKKAYNKARPDCQIKDLTPHILRHTFCTNMVNAGIDVKSLQYLMGHSTVNITLNIYAHSSYERAAAQMIALSLPKKVC